MPDNEKIFSFTKEEISLDEKLSNLPTLPRVYQLKDREEAILYVGKAKILRDRVRQYFHKSRGLDPRIALMVEKIFDVEIITNGIRFPQSDRGDIRFLTLFPEISIILGKCLRCFQLGMCVVSSVSRQNLFCH